MYCMSALGPADTTELLDQDEPEVVKEKPPLDEPVLAVVLSDLEQGVGSKVDEVVKEKPPLQEFVEPEVTVITR